MTRGMLEGWEKFVTSYEIVSAYSQGADPRTDHIREAGGWAYETSWEPPSEVCSLFDFDHGNLEGIAKMKKKAGGGS